MKVIKYTVVNYNMKNLTFKIIKAFNSLEEAEEFCRLDEDYKFLNIKKMYCKQRD